MREDVRLRNDAQELEFYRREFDRWVRVALVAILAGLGEAVVVVMLAVEVLARGCGD